MSFIHSAFGLGARVAFESLAEFSSVGAAIVRLIAVPWSIAAFYMLLAAGGNPAHIDSQSAWIAAVSVGAMTATVAGSMLSLQDAVQHTTAFHELASEARHIVWLGRATVLAGVGVASALSGCLLLPFTGAAALTPGLLLLHLACAVAAGITAVSVGFTIGRISQLVRDPLMLANLFELFLPAVIGAIAPIVLLPWPVQVLSHMFPGTYLVEAVRLLGSQPSVGTAIGLIGASVIVSGAWVIAGAVLHRVVGQQMRSRGAFDRAVA